MVVFVYYPGFKNIRVVGFGKKETGIKADPGFFSENKNVWQYQLQTSLIPAAIQCQLPCRKIKAIRSSQKKSLLKQSE